MGRSMPRFSRSSFDNAAASSFTSSGCSVRARPQPRYRARRPQTDPRRSQAERKSFTRTLMVRAISIFACRDSFTCARATAFSSAGTASSSVANTRRRGERRECFRKKTGDCRKQTVCSHPRPASSLRSRLIGCSPISHCAACRERCNRGIVTCNTQVARASAVCSRPDSGGSR